MFGTVHEYLVTYQLSVILIRCALTTGFGSKCSYHVIGFVTGNLQNRNAISTDNILYNRYG